MDKIMAKYKLLHAYTYIGEIQYNDPNVTPEEIVAIKQAQKMLEDRAVNYEMYPKMEDYDDE